MSLAITTAPFSDGALAQRRRETCVKRYKEEAEKDKPESVVEAEKGVGWLPLALERLGAISSLLSAAPRKA